MSFLGRRHAEALYKRVQVIYEKSLGPDHPNVADVADSLA